MYKNKTSVEEQKIFWERICVCVQQTTFRNSQIPSDVNKKSDRQTFIHFSCWTVVKENTRKAKRERERTKAKASVIKLSTNKTTLSYSKNVWFSP